MSAPNTPNTRSRARASKDAGGSAKNGSTYAMSASTVLVDKETDLERWRLLDERGRQTWHYLKTDKEVKAWPQTLADRHHLGLPLVWHAIKGQGNQLTYRRIYPP
jgi:hypothetical protein